MLVTSNKVSVNKFLYFVLWLFFCYRLGPAWQTLMFHIMKR